MQKPHDLGMNVHFLNQPHDDKPRSDVLGTLFDALKQAKEKLPERAIDARSVNEQRIEGEGNIQLSGEMAPLQSITGNNNIQIGAVQLVVNVMVNIER